jgi:hypothetical protein
VTFTKSEEVPSIDSVVWQFWGRAAEASLTEKSGALFYSCLTVCVGQSCGPGGIEDFVPAAYFEHAMQYPPISNRDTTIRNRQSFSTCPFSFSKISLTNSVIFPQRRHAMWMWSRFSFRS